MENSSSDSLDALSVSVYGKGVTTNDLTTDSQGTYCELGEQSQQLSQDMFLGSQDSHPSSISVLENSNAILKSSRQSGADFSTITTSSTPFAKRKRCTVMIEDGPFSPDGDSDTQRRMKIKCSSDKSPQGLHIDASGVGAPGVNNTSGGSRKNNTILISSISGENSQLNFSQLDTQLKELTDVDDMAATNGEGADESVPLVLSGKSLSSSNGLNHTVELHNLTSNSYNSHQIRNPTPSEKWANRKTITKTHTVNCTATLREIRCEATNQVLSLIVTELTPSTQTPNLSPLLSKLVPALSSGGTGARDSLSSGGSVYSAGALLSLRPPPCHEPRLSSSSSSTQASSAATLALRHQMHLHKLSQRDLPPVQCVNCSFEYKPPLLPPPLLTPDLVSSSSSLTETDTTAPAKTDSPPPHRPPNVSPPSSSLPILAATRRSSFNKKFTTLEQIKEEAKHHTAAASSPAQHRTSLTPVKRKGRPRKNGRLPPPPPSAPPASLGKPSVRRGSDEVKAEFDGETAAEKEAARKEDRFSGEENDTKGDRHVDVKVVNEKNGPRRDFKEDKNRTVDTKVVDDTSVHDTEKAEEGDEKDYCVGVTEESGKGSKKGSRKKKKLVEKESKKPLGELAESSEPAVKSISTCAKCQLPVLDRDRISCAQCESPYHAVLCMQEAGFRKMSGARKQAWTCRGCKSGLPDDTSDSIPPKLSAMAANVYDPGKTVLAIWADKIYYPAVIEQDLQSFLRVRYLDGVVKKILKVQTVPMAVLVEDTPVQVEAEDLRPAKLKAFDEDTQVCTVEWSDTRLVDTIELGDVRMFAEDVRSIQTRYNHVLETPKLHQLTLDNVLQRKRAPAPRQELFADGYSSSFSCSSRGPLTPGSSSSAGSVSSGAKRSKRTLPDVEERLNATSPRAAAPPTARAAAPRAATTGKKKKKILEEKVDNSGNRGARCRQKIFGADAANAGSSKTQIKSKSGGGGSSSGGGAKSCTSSGPPPAKRRRKSKGGGGGGAPGSPQPSCSKQGPRDRENSSKHRYFSRWEIDVAEEYCPSSDSELELENINMLGFDMDFVQSETDRGTPLSESCNIDKLCGPVPSPGQDLFSGYVFVVSHSSAALTYESDGNQSDQQYAELTSKFPFQRRRLEEQLHKGGGTVYPSLNRVPHEKLEHCLLITDRPSTTCNFVLALAMRVPVLHYYHVVQCCVNKCHIKKYRLPEMSSGYSLEDKCFLDRNLTSANILGDHMIVIAMSARSHALVFWEKVLKFAGASVKRWKPGFDWDTLVTQGQNMTIAILVDDDIPPEILTQPYECILPTWVVQSLIHAEARDFHAHPAYREKVATPAVALNNSETY